MFRACAVGRQDRLEERAMSWAMALRMIKHRALQAGHESMRTTQFYNRVQEEISLNEIDRIHISAISLQSCCSAGCRSV